MSTDKPPAWQTAVFTGSSQDNITTNQPVNTQNNSVILPSSTSTTVADTAAAPTTAASASQTNTNLPQPGSQFTSSTGKVVTIPDNWYSLTLREQVELFNKEGITPTDLKNTGWDESNINYLRQNYGYTVTDTPGEKQGPVIPNNNVTAIPTTPAVTITDQNTNNPPPSYNFEKLDGSTYTITVKEWNSFTPLQQAEWLGNKGFTEKDLIFNGFSNAAIRRYDDALIEAGITTTRFEQIQEPVILPNPSLRSGGRFVFAVGDLEKDITTPDNWETLTNKEKAEFFTDIEISARWLVLNGFTSTEIELLQENGFVITQDDLDRLDAIYFNTTNLTPPLKYSTTLDQNNTTTPTTTANPNVEVENYTLITTTGKTIDTPDDWDTFTLREKAEWYNENDITPADLLANGFTEADIDELRDADYIVGEVVTPTSVTTLDNLDDTAITAQDDDNINDTGDEAIQSNLTTVEDDDNITATSVEEIQSSVTTVDDDNTDNLGTVDDDAVESVDIPLIDTTGYLEFQDELDEQIENGTVAPYSSTNTRGITGAVSNTRAQADLQYAINFSTLDDWRVRLSLAPGANYLYNAPAAERGILAPLNRTQGVIFPYTPQITVNYVSNYDTTNPTHSNYKILQYQNSAVDSISISCDFTAQDTSEADYLLATIHFFRSVTKMFYGQDENPKRGTPPPLCYLNGLGEFQFDEHPLVITSFSYSLPDDVDYIRSMISGSNPGTQQNNSGQGGSSASTNRLAGTGVDSSGNAPAVSFSTPTTGQMSQPTYVPTKIKLTISCMPAVSRKDISDTFSLKAYANGSLLRGSKRNGGGIW